MHPKALYEKLAGVGVRIFNLRIDRQLRLYIHHDKTTAQWREDVRAFRDKVVTTGDYAHDRVVSELSGHLQKLGYSEVVDVVADVFEGRVSSTEAKIVDDPDHFDQEDGFGHYGWESQ